MKKILGISAYYHDSAAALLIDGEIAFAAQQERYTRIKHDPTFPKEAILAALGSQSLRIDELDAIVFYDKPMLKFERLLETYLAKAPRGFRSFARSMPIWLKEKLYLKSVLRRELRAVYAEQLIAGEAQGVESDSGEPNLTVDEAEAKRRAKKLKLPDLLFCQHHESHAASAFYPSPFNDAAVVCLDGVGEWATSSVWHGHGNSMTLISEVQFPHSLGLLYSAFTSYCGFKVNSGEYKLMGLAPYGQPTYADKIREHLVKLYPDGSFALNMEYFDYAVGDRMYSKKFEQLFEGKAHPFDAEPTQKQMDLAASIQVVLEDMVMSICRYAKEKTQSKYLCLAGGVALNCVANGKLRSSNLFDDIWIQPAAGDAGGALGSALQIFYQWFDGTRRGGDFKKSYFDSMQGAYLGDHFSDEHIMQACEKDSLPYETLSDDRLFTEVADWIASGNVIGWFQGKMEFGPRALGNRSIIGDARNTEMQTKMNVAIKQRESFRPFAPAVLEEDVQEWFEEIYPSPYMLLVSHIKQDKRLEMPSGRGIELLKHKRSDVPAITHVDYSARVQSVNETVNPRFHALISAFKRLTGVGMIINTSFNVRGEPPVCSPREAIRGFLATDMDILVMGNVVLHKSQMPSNAIESAKSVQFEKD